MMTRSKVAIALVAGIGLGAGLVHGLHAQAKAPVYYIVEVDVKDVDAYVKDYAPKAQELIKASGGKTLAAGQNVVGFDGAPPKKRVALSVWESMDTLRAYRASQAFKDVRKMGAKYATFRSFAVEGQP